MSTPPANPENVPVPEDRETILDYEPPRPPSLGQRVTSSFAWLIVNTVFQKLLGVGTQIVLAWLLVPDDFGLVGMAFTIAIFVNLIREAGITQVLIHRSNQFRRWSTPAFWMSLALSLLCGVIMIAAAPIAARMYGQPAIAGLITVLGLGAPVFGLGTVPGAKLQADLRFRFMTITGFAFSTLQSTLSVLMAWRGYGAYSFVWPMIIVAAIRCAVYWAAARPPIRLSPQLRRWKYLLGDSTQVLWSSAMATFMAQGSYVVLGLLHSVTVVGIYYFAFGLSMQTMVLVGYSLAQVLFPALSRLQHDPPRQTRAYLRAGRLLAAIGVPLCLLQAAAADPAIRAVFADKWEPAIPVVQVLSIGMAIRIVGWISGNLMQAQGRFRTQARMTTVFSIISIAFIVVGALLGQALSVAVAVAICFSLIDMFGLYVAIRAGGAGWRDIWDVYAAPTLVSAVAMGLAMLAGALVPDVRGRDWIRLFLISLIGLGLYAAMLRLFFAARWHEIETTVREMLVRRGPAGAPAPASAVEP